MKYVCRLLAASCLLSAVHAQWSEPVSISDTAFSYPEGFQLAAGGGDTLWASYETYDGSTHLMVVHWSMGDSWSEPETLAAGTYLWYPASGVDRQGRVWLAWSRAIPWSLGDTFGICVVVHDSLGWEDTAHLVIPRGGICHLGFVSDKHGTWYLAISEFGGIYPSLYWLVAYSRFLANRWQEPFGIAAGQDSLHYGELSFVPRPDTGLWAVYRRTCSHEETRVLIDHLIPDSARIHRADLYDLTEWSVTGDSAGQMWLIYVDTLGAVRSITYGVEGEKRRQLVTENRRYGPTVCTDAMGWVWAFWQRSDKSLVASCNWGNNWSEPEVVASELGYPVDIISDRHGRVYVCFDDTEGKYWTCYRTSRPGIGGDVAAERPAVGSKASVVRGLPFDVVAYDALGRRVLDLRPGANDVRALAPGVYFVRRASGVRRDASSVTKVIVTR